MENLSELIAAKSVTIPRLMEILRKLGGVISLALSLSLSQVFKNSAWYI